MDKRRIVSRLLHRLARRDRIALKVLATSTLESFREEAIAEFGLADLARRFGVAHLKGSGWEIHHLEKGGTRFLNGKTKRENGSSTTVGKLRDALKEGPSNPLYGELAKEAQNCALVPSWFHKLLHSHYYKGLTTRSEVYAALKNLLSQKELFQRIYALKFRGSTIAEALKSLERLLSLAWMVDDEKLQRKLKECFEDLKVEIKRSMPTILSEVPL